MSDADLVALKKAAPLIKEMLVAVDKELYARVEVRAVEGVRLVEGRNNRSWNIEDDAILKKFSGLKIPKAYRANCGRPFNTCMLFLKNLSC
jgi:hypothetical protein